MLGTATDVQKPFLFAGWERWEQGVCLCDYELLSEDPDEGLIKVAVAGAW